LCDFPGAMDAMELMRCLIRLNQPLRNSGMHTSPGHIQMIVDGHNLIERLAVGFAKQSRRK